MSSNNRTNSRFSTLKVFGLGKERPPPPPPKDAQYFPQQGLRAQGPYSSSKSLFSPSVASLAHPTEAVPSLPATPLTADYSRASPVSSQSAPSVRSFAPSGPPMSVESDGAVKPKRSIFKFTSLSKRMNKSARNLLDLDSEPQEPQEDEGISPPWNFQHEIHVEEGLTGFPPSWSTALSQAGFTEEELAGIYARRAATSVSNDTAESQEPTSRSASPLSVLRQPVPRSSSLSKGSPAARSSNATLLATAYMNSHSSPSPTASSFNVPPSRQSSYISSSSSHSNSVVDPDTGDTQYVFVNGTGRESIIDPYPLDSQSVSSHHSNSTHHATSPQIARIQSDTLPTRATLARVPSPLVHSLSLPPSQPLINLPHPYATPPQSVRSAPPRTPPRRVFHVANASDGSPPPAYSSPDYSSKFTREKAEKSSRNEEESRTKVFGEEAGHVQGHEDDDAHSILDITASADDTMSSLYTDMSLSLPSTDIDPALLNRHLSPTPPLVIDKRQTQPKVNALPPRLSFHFNADLGLDWGAGLFSSSEDGSGNASASGSGSRSEDSSAELGSGGSKIASSSKDAQRIGREADREEGSSSLFPGLSLSSSRPSRSPSTSSRTPSTPTSSKSHSPSTRTSTPSTSPSPSHSPSESSHSGTLLPILPDVSLGANITLGAPLRVNAPSSTASAIPPTPTTSVPPTPQRDLPPIPHEAVEVGGHEKNDDGLVLPDISLGPNVSLLGAGLGLDAPSKEEIVGPPSVSTGQLTSSERLPSTGKSPAAGSARSLPITDPTSRIEVTVSLQSPTSPASNSPSAISPAAKEPLAASTTGDRSSYSALLPARTAGDRDSGMSTMTVTPATIVSVSGAMAITLATASVVDSDAVSRSAVEIPREEVGSEAEDGSSIVLGSDPSWPEPPLSPDLDTTPRQPVRFRTTSLIHVQGSPHSSHFSSETGSTSTTESAPLVTPKPSLLPPSPLREKSFSPDVAFLTSMTDTFGGRETDSEEGFLTLPAVPKAHSYSQRLPSWIAEAVAPLSEFIVDVDPHQYFADLQEIAEGESGSVYAARVVSPLEELSLPAGTVHVAVKAIAVQPSMSPKLQDLRHEMELMRGVNHEHVLRMDAFYVNLVDDSVWIRMELMERSLADVVALVSQGLSLQERMIGRFTSDVLLALEYLQKHHIAHRDVRSDNLLLNVSGIVKVADFSNAVRVTRNSPMCVGAVGVIYWQAPEMRAGAYNALKVDVWSLGATVWELAQTEPPFADVQNPHEIGSQWPALRHPELYSRNFHEFLRLCSRQSASRPNANELLNTPFIRNACGRIVIVQLLSQCRAIEEQVHLRESAGDS